eukprot:scaffold4004_cov105-Cylindrotheca_fusiformis.AAC.7
MFTPAVRRDIYRILRHPTNPGADGAAPSSTSNGQMFESMLLAKSSSEGGGVDAAWDSFAFCRRQANAPAGYTVLDDEQMLEAISSIGKITPVALAVTQAFEAYLAQLVQNYWGEREASVLSVDFLVAFGNEMTQRLDVNHRIRSTRLSPHEIQILSEQPFCNFVDRESLEAFQGQGDDDDIWQPGMNQQQHPTIPLAGNYGNSNLGVNSRASYGPANQGIPPPQQQQPQPFSQPSPFGYDDPLRPNNNYNNNNRYNNNSNNPYSNSNSIGSPSTGSYGNPTSNNNGGYGTGNSYASSSSSSSQNGMRGVGPNEPLRPNTNEIRPNNNMNEPVMIPNEPFRSGTNNNNNNAYTGPNNNNNNYNSQPPPLTNGAAAGGYGNPYAPGPNGGPQSQQPGMGVGPSGAAGRPTEPIPSNNNNNYNNYNNMQAPPSNGGAGYGAGAAPGYGNSNRPDPQGIGTGPSNDVLRSNSRMRGYDNVNNNNFNQAPPPTTGNNNNYSNNSYGRPSPYEGADSRYNTNDGSNNNGQPPPQQQQPQQRRSSRKDNAQWDSRDDRSKGWYENF